MQQIAKPDDNKQAQPDHKRRRVRQHMQQQKAEYATHQHADHLVQAPGPRFADRAPHRAVRAHERQHRAHFGKPAAHQKRQRCGNHRLQNPVARSVESPEFHSASICTRSLRSAACQRSSASCTGVSMGSAGFPVQLPCGSVFACPCHQLSVSLLLSLRFFIPRLLSCRIRYCLQKCRAACTIMNACADGFPSGRRSSSDRSLPKGFQKARGIALPAPAENPGSPAL